jgi:hypothetical protein
VACPGGASKGVKCFEPLQRVVGGFGTSFGFTPTLL